MDYGYVVNKGGEDCCAKKRCLVAWETTLPVHCLLIFIMTPDLPVLTLPPSINTNPNKINDHCLDIPNTNVFSVESVEPSTHTYKRIKKKKYRKRKSQANLVGADNIY